MAQSLGYWRPQMVVAVICDNDNLGVTIRRELDKKNCMCMRLEASKLDLTPINRIVFYVEKNLPYQAIEQYTRLISEAKDLCKCVLIIQEEPASAEKLLRIWNDGIRLVLLDNAVEELQSWLKTDVIFVLPVGRSTQEQEEDCERLINSLVQQGFSLRKRRTNTLEWNDISDNMAECDKVLVVYFKPPGQIPSHARGHLYQMAFDRMIALRKHVLAIVKMFANSDDGSEDQVLKNHRIKTFVKVFSQRETLLDDFRVWLNTDSTIQKTIIFGSLGNGFAWQFATGFLAYIMPNLTAELKAQLTDESGYIREDIFSTLDLDPPIDRKKIAVLSKFYILLREDDVDSDKHVNPNPWELFRNCCKLKLRDDPIKYQQMKFKSPGYTKHVPLYLAQLQSEVVGYTHAVFIAGFAAPVSIIRELRGVPGLTDEILHSAYTIFKEELQFILNHPRANELLAGFAALERHDLFSNADKAACIMEWKRSQSPDECHQVCLSRIREEVEADHFNRRIRSLTDEVEKNMPDEDVIVVKFSKSTEPVLGEAVKEKLQNAKFDVRNFELMSQSFAQVLIKCRKMVLFASLQDLNEFNSAYTRQDYNDREHNHLLRDITSAVTYLHMRQEYNLVVVVITNDDRADIYSALPSVLKILPENNVVSLANLAPADLDNMQLAYTGGDAQRCNFADLIQRLNLNGASIKVDEFLPLMSMAYSMAANNCFGFVMHLIQFYEGSSCPPFTPPYKLVVPRSARYPDNESLRAQLSYLGVTVDKKEFRNDEHRLYTYTLCTRTQADSSQEMSVAFEVPTCVLNLRKQAKCGLGGIRRTGLKQHLAEYSMALTTMLECMQWSKFVKVLDWQDECFPSDAWRNPTPEYVESFRDLLFKD